MPRSKAINGEPDVALDPDDANRPQLPTDDEDGPSEADDDEFALPPDGQGLEEDTEDDEEDDSDGEDGAESGPESDVYEAEEIRAERVKGGKTQYEIKWLGLRAIRDVLHAAVEQNTLKNDTCASNASV